MIAWTSKPNGICSKLECNRLATWRGEFSFKWLEDETIVSYACYEHILHKDIKYVERSAINVKWELV